MRFKTWIAAAAAVAVVAALTGQSQANHLSGTLRVATWGGSWKEAIHKLVGAKLEAHGVKVEYVLGNPEDSIAKLVAARGRDAPFDVMEGSPVYVDQVIQEGFVEKLDFNNIPNAKGFPSFAVSDHTVVTLWAQEGIVYNADKFKEMGIDPPKTYGDLANPKLKGHVAWPDAATTLTWNSSIGLAYEIGGDETTPEKSAAQVNKIEPLYFYRASTDLATKFGLGDVWAAPWHAGWVVRLRRKGLPLEIAHPKIGNHFGAINGGTIHVVKGAKNKAAAEAFINEYISAETAYAFAKQTGIVPMHEGARKRLMDAPESRHLLLEKAQVDNFFLVDWAKLDQKKWRDTFTRQLKR